MGDGVFDGLPALPIRGLSDLDARTLLQAGQIGGRFGGIPQPANGGVAPAQGVREVDVSSRKELVAALQPANA
jgi:hypothetical protein